MFSAVEDVEFGEKKVLRLGFGAYAIGLRMNDARVAFPMMIDNTGLTFLTTIISIVVLCSFLSQYLL